MSRGTGLRMSLTTRFGRQDTMSDRSAVLDLAASENPIPEREAVRARRTTVICVGFLPPPIDGQRLITQRMFDRLCEVADVRPLDLDRFRRFGSLSKPLSALLICVKLAIARVAGASRLYLAPHSGRGLLYSCLIVLISRLLSYGIFVHYHSYKNMGARSRLMELFLKLCGGGTTHVVLAPPMAQDLRSRYPSAKQVFVLSNSVFIAPRVTERDFARRPLRVGHLSNLSNDKGLVQVLDFMARIAGDPGIEFVLAGPAEDENTRRSLDAALAELGSAVSYLGRLDRRQVAAFYGNIDVFLFPSLYEHEAEPLVLIEAMSFGVPVITTSRGCIPYLLGPDCGRLLEPAEFVDEAINQTAAWSRNRIALADASRRAVARYHELRGQSRPQLDRLLAKISLDDRG
jgi:glycosyltransferase involved in cell wall biosynthesis